MDNPSTIVAFALAAVLVAACATTRVTSAPVAERNEIERTGSGMVNTDQFLLVGDYRAEWSSTGPSGRECVTGFFLRHERTATGPSLIAGRTGGGSTRLYDLEWGAYYAEAISNCTWKLTLTPT